MKDDSDGIFDVYTNQKIMRLMKDDSDGIFNEYIN